jgi:hypothetical protein
VFIMSVPTDNSIDCTKHLSPAGSREQTASPVSSEVSLLTLQTVERGVKAASRKRQSLIIRLGERKPVLSLRRNRKRAGSSPAVRMTTRQLSATPRPPHFFRDHNLGSSPSCLSRHWNYRVGLRCSQALVSTRPPQDRYV